MKQESLEMFLKCCLTTTITNLAMGSKQMALKRRKLCQYGAVEIG